jgi:hypothetical protein
MDTSWRAPNSESYAARQRELSPNIAPALEEGMAEVLPALQNLLLEKLSSPEPVEETVRQFVAARQLSSHRIAHS